MTEEGTHIERSSSHQLAYGILVAAWGDHRASEVWNGWSPEERAVVAHAAEARRSTVQQIADDLIAWLTAG